MLLSYISLMGFFETLWINIAILRAPINSSVLWNITKGFDHCYMARWKSVEAHNSTDWNTARRLQCVQGISWTLPHFLCLAFSYFKVLRLMYINIYVACILRIFVLVMFVIQLLGCCCCQMARVLELPPVQGLWNVYLLRSSQFICQSAISLGWWCWCGWWLGWEQGLMICLAVFFWWSQMISDASYVWLFAGCGITSGWIEFGTAELDSTIKHERIDWISVFWATWRESLRVKWRGWQML